MFRKFFLCPRPGYRIRFQALFRFSWVFRRAFRRRCVFHNILRQSRFVAPSEGRSGAPDCASEAPAVRRPWRIARGLSQAGRTLRLKALQAQAMKSHVEGQIRFVNYRRDIINFYDQADVFVLTSYREGLPVALLEAMYCGVPAVASDIRGVRDVIENGETGIVCAPDDSEAFAAAIKRLKEDLGLRKQYGENGRKAVTPYMLSAVKDTVLDIYNKID